jgi:2-dehydropantoate 2-reductase
MGKHIAFIGSGAVGSYVAGRLASRGEDVSLVCLRPQTAEHIRADGLHLSDTEGEDVVRINALNLYEVQSFLRHPVDIAAICVKSFDTAWATALVSQYLAPNGFVVSMQNGINEEAIASVVGWGRTTGCVMSAIGVSNYAPGSVRRHLRPSGSSNVVFRAGEVHGRATPRITEFAEMLRAVDSSAVTPNLWGERWTKLVVNSLMHGPIGAGGGNFDHIWRERGIWHRVAIAIAAEGIAVGRALGYELGNLYGATPDDWTRAAAGDAKALAAVQAGLIEQGKRQTTPTTTSLGRDLERGLRTEVDYTVGFIASKAAENGIAAPVSAATTAMIKRAERGELQRDPSNLEGLV